MKERENKGGKNKTLIKLANERFEELGKNQKRKRINDIKYYLNRNYNITIENYKEMIISQKNKCAICRTDLDDIQTYVDHDHNSGFVRGLLCVACNSGLGMFKDNISFLNRAIDYLIDSLKKERQEED